jgi:uncharacterized iron-regulated membrane protein
MPINVTISRKATNNTLAVRRGLRFAHMWLGVIGGVFVCLMAVTGAVVTLRPPLAQWMAPATASPTGCGQAVDWAQAEQRIHDFTDRPINRIYAFDNGDPRFHLRMATATPAIYQHVIYDACAGRVLGTINLAWMDWLVDLHHNLLSGRTGRFWGGIIGVALLVSSVSGLLYWILGRPRPLTAFRVRPTKSGLGFSREWHRVIGLGVMSVLCLEAYTGLWLCFPAVMRATLPGLIEAAQAPRPGRAKPDPSRPPADLATVMASAREALPDGAVREVRLPDGYGNVQVRMWRVGDFRSLGNNVVTVSNTTGRVVGVERYAEASGSKRFVEAMSGLHYGEWSGLPFRMIYVVAGLATLLLFVTGLVVWKGTRAPMRMANQLLHRRAS